MTAVERGHFAPAKINLALHVTGRRDDGYHLLDSLVVFADIGDRVTARPARAWSLRVTGPLARGVPEDDDNLILRAARATDGPPAAFTLDKHLPMEAGIGGGTSDAAAALRALAALDGRRVPPDPVRLGADLPVCLLGRACRMEGVGEVVTPLAPLPPLHAVLVNPGIGIATPKVFGALTNRENAPLPRLPDIQDTAAFARWLAEQRNDLEGPARLISPAVGVALAQIGATDGCLLARMSGSGATCFGLFETATEAALAAERIAASRPEWWVRAAALG